MPSHTRPARRPRAHASSIFERLVAPLALCLLLLATLACGPTEGGVAADTLNGGGGTATVGVLVTDAPSDEFIAVNLTVRTITLLGGPAGPVVIFDGLETFDLLALRDVSEMFAISDDVPAGTYAKVRLTLVDDGIELVVDDGQGGEDYYYPNIPGNDKLDLIPTNPLVLNGGDAIGLEIDVDVEKSIHIHRTGNGNRNDKYQFRPVVFVRVVRDLLDGRLVRLHGIVADIDLPANAFSLCRLRRPLAWLPSLQGLGAQPGSIDDLAGDAAGTGAIEIPGIDPEHPRLRCIAVHLTADASLFDTDGTPIRLGDVAAGDRATVVGRLRPRLDRRFELFASLVLLGPPGTFEHRVGMIVSDFDPAIQQFVLELASGNGDLNVRIFPTTKLFERGGMAIGPDAIMPGVPASVTGVIHFSSQDPALMNAAIGVLDLEAVEPEPLSGTITRLNATPGAGECPIDLDVSGAITGVAVDSQTVIVALDLSLNQSMEIEFGDLVVGDVADVYGVPSSAPGGCFAARTIVVFEPAP